ncbi:MAG: hypothetical protein UT32_C0026G0018 [Parcubacteria group bacterium GW2011_GWC2_39_14]|nr:MAG: hypothetical protein UT32_C0026G0018 [Parcubacteria group bacterium GW2011_GWC2_39_14]KKR53440.1 MAG: hypothetical protein UT91_C0027G0018 [Parcubacteria group bacterium GW2011_GWA2_40_23]
MSGFNSDALEARNQGRRIRAHHPEKCPKCQGKVETTETGAFGVTIKAECMNRSSCDYAWWNPNL